MLSNEKEKKKTAVLEVRQMDQWVIQVASTTHFNTNLCCATSLLWPVRSKTAKTRWPQTPHQSTYNMQIPVFKINNASSTTRKQQISTQRWHWLCTDMSTDYANKVPPFLHNSVGFRMMHMCAQANWIWSRKPTGHGLTTVSFIILLRPFPTWTTVCTE